MGNAALVVDRLRRWRELLDWVPLKGPSPALTQLKRELDEELNNAILLRTREETKEGA